MATQNSLRILVLGAAYGALFGARCVAAGHSVQLVGRPAEVALINRDGIIVHLPETSGSAPLTLRSPQLAGTLTAATPTDCDPAAHDLIVLAMQEPQFQAPELKALLEAIGRSERPCLSIMNMPPLPYLRRLPDIAVDALRDCYTAPAAWDALDPARVTLCSPDPQAMRLPDGPLNEVHVRLATNFKAAPFAGRDDNALLQRLAADIDAVRLPVCGVEVAPPVKLKAHDSSFVPLAKWCMLLAGNYRCIGESSMCSIRDAVHANLAATRSVYDLVGAVILRLGAHADDLVPFAKYAAAATSLTGPSSAARALAAGARDIERIDRVVQHLARSVGLGDARIDAIVSRVDDWLDRNRQAQYAA